MNILNYLLVKETIWDQLKEEVQDVLDMFADFFLMIKEVTYDVIANYIGTDITNLLLIAIGVIIILHIISLLTLNITPENQLKNNHDVPILILV